MAGNEDVAGSPIELLRQLIEESGKWTRDLVRFTRTLVTVFVALAIFYLYSYSKSVLDFLSKDGPIAPVILGIPILLLLIYAGWYTFRNYKTQVRRKDTWKHKFEILKKKEEEIEKLLSEGAD